MNAARRASPKSVFASIFPVSDFRETATLEFVAYQIGNWQCKCGNLEGLEHLRANCKNCGAKIKVDPFNPAEVLWEAGADEVVSTFEGYDVAALVDRLRSA